nr:aminotransferase class IV [Clostridium tetanomorphum]
MFNDEVVSTKSFNEEELLAGKSLYEVIKVKEKVPLFLEKHLERLHNSANITDLQLWISNEDIERRINKLIQVNKAGEGSAKIILNFQKKQLLAFFEEKSFPQAIQYEEGIYVCLYHKERINPNAKVLNMEFRKDLDQFIKSKNIFEAILVDKNGYITEGSKSNVFMLKGEKLITSPLKTVLPGTTRSVVLEICKDLNIELVEENLHYNDIDKIEGMFISSTPFDILPVKRIEDIYLNSSENHIIKSIMNEYKNIVNDYININLEKYQK